MDRALLVAIGFLAGVIVGGFAVGYLIPAETDIGGTDGPPAYSYSVATSSQVDTASDGGWLHEVHIRDRVVLTGNATVVHDGDQTVNLNVSRTAPDTYELAFETVPGEDTGKGSDGRVASTLEWGVELPADYDSYVVSMDGEVVTRVENDDETTSRLMRLPQPLAE